MKRKILQYHLHFFLCKDIKNSRDKQRKTNQIYSIFFDKLDCWYVSPKRNRGGSSSESSYRR